MKLTSEFIQHTFHFIDSNDKPLMIMVFKAGKQKVNTVINITHNNTELCKGIPFDKHFFDIPPYFDTEVKKAVIIVMNKFFKK